MKTNNKTTIQIGELLKKFTTLTPPHSYIKKTTIKIIFDLCGETITTEQITVSKNTIYIDTTPATKNHIFINKTKILEKLNKHAQKPAITNIY